jgi:hypothetical protein
MGQAEREVIVALPARVLPARHARSTLIMASIQSVRKRGQFEEYERHLSEEHKATLLNAIAATWLPLDAALAHYAACDALGLSPEQQVQAGRSTFDGARGTILGTAVRMARGAGVTPWQALPLTQRFWDRGCDGGAVGVVRTGPKDAEVKLVQCSLLGSSYFRNGLRGLFAALVELFCTRAYVTERRRDGMTGVEYRLQWA